jgi:hypothetical protein
MHSQLPVLESAACGVSWNTEPLKGMSLRCSPMLVVVHDELSMHGLHILDGLAAD